MLQAAKYIGSGLATIGLTKQILAPTLSPNILCTSVISPLATKAISTVDEMLISLPKDSLVLQHIQNVAASVEVQVTATANNGIITPDTLSNFLSDRPLIPATRGAGRHPRG